MNEPVEIDIQLTEKDYRDVLKEQSISAIGKGRLWVYGTYFMVVLLIVIYTILTTKSISMFTLMPLIIIVLLIVLSLHNIRKNSKFIFQNDALLQQPYKIKMDTDGLSLNSKTSNWQLNWSDVYDFTITKHAILIYLTPIRALIIPERCLQNSDQIKNISNLLFSKTQKSKI